MLGDVADALCGPRFITVLSRLGKPLGMLVPSGQRRRPAGREMTVATFVLISRRRGCRMVLAPVDQPLDV
jgi:hypothetical protein